MSGRRIMYAVAVPLTIEPIEAGKALHLAAGLEAEIELFHCVFDRKVAHPGRFAGRGAQALIRELTARRRAALEGVAESLRGRGARVRTSVRWDHPTHEGIIRQVLRHKPDLLIVQSTRKRALARRLLTRTDFKLIEACPCPLLFLKTRRPYADPVIVAAVDPEGAHGKPQALDAAILELADRLRAVTAGKLLVFHATAPWEKLRRGSRELRAVPQAVLDDVRSAHWNQGIGEIEQLARRWGVKREQIRLAEGDPAQALTAFANAALTDIVALGAASRPLIRRIVVGHTAERVLDRLDADVLIVKPPQFRSAVRRASRHHVERSAGPRARIVW